jgi:VanZ family protein
MWQRKLLAILCGVMIILVLIATLWPLDFFRRNDVRWLPGGKGIQFAGPGVVLSDRLLKPGGSASSNSCSLEILLRPAAVESLHTILSFYAPSNTKQFMIRQFTDGLLVSRDFVDAKNGVKTAKISVEHIFQPGKLVLVTMTSGPNGTVIYTNGTPRQAIPSFTVVQNDFAGQVVLGTSPVHYDPWLGEVHGIAIYSEELTPAEVLRHYRGWMDEREGDLANLTGVIARYDLTDGRGRKVHNAVSSGPNLEIPKWFEVPHKPFLQSPWKHFSATRYYLHDVLLNIAGFVPLGFILCLYLSWTRNRRRAILHTILAGAVLSFSIEVLQAYVPQRDSGMTDVITNTLGTALGALLARRGRVWQRRRMGHLESNT